MSEASEFFKAVASGDLPIVRELLARTPSLVNVKDGEGATPLHYAALNGKQELARFLVEQGADVNARDERFGATPAGWAIEYLRGLGGFLAIEIEDMILAIRQGDVGLVRRFLTRCLRSRGAETAAASHFFSTPKNPDTLTLLGYSGKRRVAQQGDEADKRAPPKIPPSWSLAQPSAATQR